MLHQPQIGPKLGGLRTRLDSLPIGIGGCGEVLSCRGLLCRGKIGLQLFIVVGLDCPDGRG